MNTLSTEQLHLYLHTIEKIMHLLEDVAPHRLREEDQKQYEPTLQQAYVVEDQIIFEIARRQLAALQAQLTGEHDTVDVPFVNEEQQGA